MKRELSILLEIFILFDMVFITLLTLTFPLIKITNDSTAINLYRNKLFRF